MQDSQIPSEAAFVKREMLQFLQTQEDLTITFDGNTTRGQDSVYTVHVITPDRIVFLWDGDELSDYSHTGAHLTDTLELVRHLIRSKVLISRLNNLYPGHQAAWGEASLG